MKSFLKYVAAGAAVLALVSIPVTLWPGDRLGSQGARRARIICGRPRSLTCWDSEGRMSREPSVATAGTPTSPRWWSSPRHGAPPRGCSKFACGPRESAV